MEAIYKERLLKLAAALETSPENFKSATGLDEFDLSTIYDDERTCGTAGCAMGALPAVFDEWCYDVCLGLSLRGSNTNNYRGGDVNSFFGIADSERLRLFYPDGICALAMETDAACPWRDFPLLNDSLPETVAKGIRLFVEWREAKDNPVAPTAPDAITPSV